MTRREAEKSLRSRKEVETTTGGKTYRGKIIMRYGNSSFFVFVGRNGKGPEIRIMAQAKNFFPIGR